MVQYISTILSCILYIAAATGCSQDKEGVSGNNTPKDTSKVDQTFMNPIMKTGADPWMIFHNGYYYYTHTVGDHIFLIKSKTITDIANKETVTVWQPSQGNQKAKYNIWGPHLNYVDGEWYIYYAAQSVQDSETLHQRMWVLKSKTESPMGPYEEKGEVLASNDTEWAIDGSVLVRKDGSLYFIWSGLPDKSTLYQHTYIARMKSPTRVDRSTITQISSPTEPWETSIRPIQEGQRPLYIDKNGKSIIMFSANASWTDEYCLGSLTNTDGNFLNPDSWKKSDGCLFKKTNQVFGPAGASYVKSPDRTEDWIIYHAAKSKGAGWDRNIRAQQFSWDGKENPVFGDPVPVGIPIDVPSGG